MALGILDGSQIICPYCSMEEGAGSLLLSRRLARAFVSAQPIAVRRGQHAGWELLAKRNGHLVRIVRIG